MSFAILIHFLRTQHVSDINISIIRSLRLCCWITKSVVLFSARCVLEIWCGWVWVVQCCRQKHSFSLQHTQRTENKTTDVVIQQHRRKLLVMDILMSETCWVHKKWNKIASDIKLVFCSSTDSRVWVLSWSCSTPTDKFRDTCLLQIISRTISFSYFPIRFISDSLIRNSTQ